MKYITKKTFILIIITTVFLGSFYFVSGSHKDNLESNPGITPASPVYFIDGLFEDIKLFFTFDKETKSLIYVDLISERFAEIEYIFSNQSDLRADYLNIAEDKINNHISGISELLDEIENEGREVGSIAQKIDKNFDEIISDFDDSVDGIVSDLNKKRQNLESNIKSDFEEGSDIREDNLDEIKSIISDIKFIEIHADNLIFRLRDKEEVIEDFMLDMNKAKNDLSEIKNDFDELREEANIHNLNLPTGYFMTINYFDFVDQAESEIEDLNFSEAMSYIGKAKSSIDSFRDLITERKESLFRGYRFEITILETKQLFDQREEISTEAKNSYTRFISQAEAEFEAGNFERAEELAKQAKEVIIKEN